MRAYPEARTQLISHITRKSMHIGHGWSRAIALLGIAEPHARAHPAGPPDHPGHRHGLEPWPPTWPRPKSLPRAGLPQPSGSGRLRSCLSMKISMVSKTAMYFFILLKCVSNSNDLKAIRSITHTCASIVAVTVASYISLFSSSSSMQDYVPSPTIKCWTCRHRDQTNLVNVVRMCNS